MARPPAEGQCADFNFKRTMYMNGSKQKMGRRRLAIVLAAGEGTRMKSAMAKVLHPIAHRSMLGHVLTQVAAIGADTVVVVVGPEHNAVAAEAARFIPNRQVFVQAQQCGTAHAVLAARPALEQSFDDILIVFADSPLVQAATLRDLSDAVAAEVAVAVLGFYARNPDGYGRLIVDNETIIGIREHGDASSDERALTLCNAGLMAIAGRHALPILSAIDNHNRKGEYYLTDAVAIATSHHWRTALVMADEDEVLGVNDRVQLAQAEAVFQSRMRQAVMHAGATLVAPETVFFAYDTQIGRDVWIGPHVVFGPGVVVEDGARIEAFSHIEGAAIGRGSMIGPFARLRPGTRLSENVKIGNFVETKAALVGPGSKMNHLSYIGDAQVGAHANIGAGTITCNFDGQRKHQTIIGDGAFVGSNSALVAPITVGAGAYIGSGSVITDDVPDDALALARGRQVNIGNWALRRRQAAERK
jgi:bifunctional UDP-N-acetylglucosamine pyrophosphorylase/glucosamine-1-phosphate N-acetyltransferase